MTATVSAAFFTYGPYFALFGFVGAWMYRWGILRNDFGPRVRAIGAPAEGALVIGFLTLVVGHGTTAVAPGAMRALLADPDRVAVIETVGLVGALLFAWGVGARLRRRIEAMRAGVPQQEPRVLVLGLLFLVCCTGIYLTVAFRWITVWYAYISVPYVRSLVLLEPATDAVVASPFAVKLHMSLLLMLVASWPMAGLPWSEIAPFKAVARRLAEEPAAAPEMAP